MSNTTTRAGVSYLLSSTDSFLERKSRDPQNKTTLSEIQTQVDNLVTHSIDQAFGSKTLVAMVAGGFASRFARMGALETTAPFLSKGEMILPFLARGNSYAVALGAESFTFAGVNRGLNNLEGHRSIQPFTQEWAHAGITLGLLKSFGALTKEQNVLLQHLTTDLGLVAGQNLGAAAQLEPKPQGDFLQQMLSAEAMNWQMKAGMSLVHSLTPGLLPLEKSMDLLLQSQETDGGFKREPTRLFFSRFAFAAEGGPEIALTENGRSKESKESHLSQMSGDGGGKGAESDIATYVKMLKTSYNSSDGFEAVIALKNLAKAGHEGALAALVDGAKTEYGVSFNLRELAREGHDKAQQALKTLDITAYSETFKTEPSAMRNLISLAEDGNEEALKLIKNFDITAYT